MNRTKPSPRPVSQYVRLSPRRGFALLIALLALVLIGALMTATAFRVGEATRVARNATLGALAQASAEGALWSAMGTANATLLRSLPRGATFGAASTIPSTSVTITRTDTTIFWLVASATRSRGRDTARARLALSATLSRDTAVHALAPIHDHAWVPMY